MQKDFYVPCTLGLEGALVQELQELGAAGIEAGKGGVGFRGEGRLGYAANLWLRSGIRVQELLGEFPAGSPEELYRGVSNLDWAALMSVDQTLAVDASVRDSNLRHSKYAALVVKDAVVDQFRNRLGRRPDVDRQDPDLPLKLVVDRDRGLLYRNLSGASLHKRGWRPIQVKSPLNEATAAGLLILSGWDRCSNLVDPMCGSGTLVIEAALLAADRAPGLQRSFPFERWPDFDAPVLDELRLEAEQRAGKELPFLIEGADRHGGALELAGKSARAAGVGALVSFRRSELRSYVPSSPPALVIVNPPYGHRLGRGRDLLHSWKDLGTFLHEACPGAEAWVLCGDPGLSPLLRLKADARLPVRNGPLDCRFLRYRIQGKEGSGRGGEPSAWVKRHAGLLPEGGRILDLACGKGRNTRFLLDRGFRVTALDRDLSGIRDLMGRKGLEALEADLQGEGAWPLAGRSFEGIVVTDYLWRPLFPRILEALAPGGVLIYETIARGQERSGKPRNPDFLLEPGELLQAFGEDLSVLAYEHGEEARPHPGVRQRICARREA